jgi:hypothetical protein
MVRQHRVEKELQATADVTLFVGQGWPKFLRPKFLSVKDGLSFCGMNIFLGMVSESLSRDDFFFHNI